jgi:predicted transcriptional regulator
MIYSIKHAEKKAPFNGNIMRMKVEVLCNLYEYYIETVARDPRYIEQNFKACAKYYNEVYREIKDKIEDKILSEYYSSVMRNSFMGNRLHGIIPVMGIKEWLEKLETCE